MSEIVLAARGWVGTPYRHRSSLKGAGCDCLGLILGVWRETRGVELADLPTYSADWGEAGQNEPLLYAARRHLRETSNEAPGTVLLFRMRSGAIAKHLGILTEESTFIHAYSGHGVVESALTLPWRRRIAARFEFHEGSN